MTSPQPGAAAASLEAPAPAARTPAYRRKLFWIALLPFPTAVLGEHGDTAAAVVLYAATIILTGLSSTALWWYAAVGRARLRADTRPLTHESTDPEKVRRGLAGGVSVVVGFVPS